MNKQEIESRLQELYAQRNKALDENAEDRVYWQIEGRISELLRCLFPEN